MSFDAHEVHAEVHRIFSAVDFRAPPFSTTTVTERLFPELAIHGAPLDQFARIEVFHEPLASGKQAIITYDDRSAHPTHRFSIAHEIAHWAFDFRCGKNPSAVVQCGERGKSEAERRADYFAAELLAPLWILDGHCRFKLGELEDADDRAEQRNGTQRLASRFNVSLKCMQLRLRDLALWRQMRRGR